MQNLIQIYHNVQVIRIFTNWLQQAELMLSKHPSIKKVATQKKTKVCFQDRKSKVWQNAPMGNILQYYWPALSDKTFVMPAFFFKPLDVANSKFAGEYVTWCRGYWATSRSRSISNNVFSCKCFSSLTIGRSNLKPCKRIYDKEGTEQYFLCNPGHDQRSNYVFSCKCISSLTVGRCTLKPNRWLGHLITERQTSKFFSSKSFWQNSK